MIVITRGFFMANMSIQIQPAAAGFIIYKREHNTTFFLGLVALKKFQTRNKGLYDIPKGRLDGRETPLQAAYRECWEEAQLKPKNIIAGPYKHSRLCVWVAESDEDPTITPNPETGELEHLGYRWVTSEEMISHCLDYLKPFVVWADEEICKLH